MNIWQISHKIKQRTTALRCDVKVAQHTVERSVSVYSGPSGSSSILVMVNLSEMIFASKSQQMDHSACFSCFFAGNEKTVSPKLTKDRASDPPAPIWYSGINTLVLPLYTGISKRRSKIGEGRSSVSVCSKK